MARTADWIRVYLWPQAPTDRGSGREWVDYSTISRLSVKPRRARAGDVLDSQGEQVGESTTRLRMPAEGSHFEVAGWEERSGEWGESTDLVHGLATPSRCASHRGLEGDGKLRNSCTVPFQLGLWALR
jgi:hypothetical protein